jgi:hypothetical protein
LNSNNPWKSSAFSITTFSGIWNANIDIFRSLK